MMNIFVTDFMLRTCSHAAVVARGMGKCCVSGCQEIDVSNKKETIVLANGKVGLFQSLLSPRAHVQTPPTSRV